MTSAGKNKGFKCKKCGRKIESDDKVPIIIQRFLKMLIFMKPQFLQGDICQNHFAVWIWIKLLIVCYLFYI